jgi:coproporphyrinogen III oxidase
MLKEEISESFKLLQDRICSELELIDGKSKFLEDKWSRTEGGGGRTRVISKGNIFEKGGVNFSEVHGDVSLEMKSNLNTDAKSFFATGVSIVLHPFNPRHPIIHMNVRYFELDDNRYWFGGGIDLTPHVIDPKAAKEFHLRLKEICDRYNFSFYNEYKDWADNYFFLPHRNESRGVGGIFFDQLVADNQITKESIHSFCIDLGDSFASIYNQQLELVDDVNFKPEELKWRNLRRGRYVEFNLVNDRGTKFGLVSGGRTESILMSLPPDASWEYSYNPLDCKQIETQKFLQMKVDWVNYQL